MKGPFCELSVRFGISNEYCVSAKYDITSSEPAKICLRKETFRNGKLVILDGGEIDYTGQAPMDLLLYYGPLDDSDSTDAQFLEAAAKLLSEL